MARSRHVLLSLALAASLTARAVSAADLKDLYFGEALFEAEQGHYFEALERLDAELAQHRRVDEPERDTLHYHIGTAEFDVGDFELNYRMHHRAGRAIKAVLEGERRRGRPQRSRVPSRAHPLPEGPAGGRAARAGANPRQGARSDSRRPRVPARERLPGARAPGRCRAGAHEAAGRARPERLRRLQPRHRAAAGRSLARGPAAARPGGPDREPRSCDRGDPRQVEHGARQDDARVRPTSIARSNRSIACGSTGRFRTRRCSAPAGPTLPPAITSARSFRGAS